MSFFSVLVQALVEPARELGVPSLPQRLLDFVVPDRVGGRRAWAAEGRAAIEARSINRPGAEAYAAELEAALEEHRCVAWARVNAPLGRVVVSFAVSAEVVSGTAGGDDADGHAQPAGDRALLAELVGVVDAVESRFVDVSGPDRERIDSPVDRVPVERAVVDLVAGLAGLAAAVAARALNVPALPQELAAAVSVVDSTPRLRQVVERELGQPTADTAIALANATVQALAQGVVGLGVDTAQRVLTLVEARAEAAAWRGSGAGLFADPHTAWAGPVTVERPAPLRAGPVEAWADGAAAVGLATFGVAVPATGQPRQAVGFALAALPKAGRAGREGFATRVGTVLARRGALVLDPGALRCLDRVGTVVLDASILKTGRYLPGRVIPLAGADPAVAVEKLHALFRGEVAAEVRGDGEWVLGPVDGLALTGRRGVRERRRLEAGSSAGVLGLAKGRRLMAVVSVVEEPHESLEALAAACHRSGRRLVLAGEGPASLLPAADALMPGGSQLLGTVKALQADGTGVLLVSSHRQALANADVGVGVSAAGSGESGPPPWGAHVLVGGDFSLVALLIEACSAAEAVSRRSVALAQAGTALGGVSATAAATGAAAPRSLLAVNMAAALSMGLGVWSAAQLLRRPVSPPISRVPWHAMPAANVLDRLNTSAEGLTTQEAHRRARAGERVTPEPLSLGGAVVEELDNPLTPILGAGAALSAAIGAVVDAGLVAGVTLLSAVIGGLQRRGTDRALDELLTRTALTARVLRDGKETRVQAGLLVPGDVILAGPGDVVAADCRILETARLDVDESSLTGEPFPVSKTAAPVIADIIAERSSMLYEGTTVAAGRAVAVVVATGSSTEAGRSMAATRPGAGTGGVEARLARITNVTLPITLGSAVAVVAAGLARGRPFRATAGAGVSLAVAAVPEGLPFLVSAAQLASARRLSGEGTLVRNPRTIEALGRVNVLGFDKTGTLTEGRIALSAVTGPDGKATGMEALDPDGLQVLAAGLRATPQPRAGHRLEHMTDRAVTDGARDAGVTRVRQARGWRRVRSLPFEPSRAYHATLGSTGTGAVLTGAVLSVKGAPETLLARCTHLSEGPHDGGGRTGKALNEGARRRISARVEKLAGHGYRVLAVAERRYDTLPGRLEDDDVADLTLLGFLALTDPVRPAAGASVAALRQAGVQIIMITGDHPGTATAIARRLDLLNGGRVITGSELGALSDDALARVLPHVTVVARSTPAHKVRVVQAFQTLGRTVAMTGDGANDAPAIRLADVGIALGRRGTPAARAAADLVVTDDRLETIISALVEGRAMWGSVREALGILVGGNLGEIAFTVLGALATGLSPLAARQLLLVNLLTDLAPALAVALRPPHAASAEALLAEGPEASLGAALTREVALRAAVTAAGAGVAWLAAIALGLAGAAPTVALAALVATQLGQTLTAGGPGRGVLLSGTGSLGVLAAIIQTPALSSFFGSTPLGVTGWAIATAASIGTVALSTLAPRILEQFAVARTPATDAPRPQPTVAVAA